MTFTYDISTYNLAMLFIFT